MLVVERWNRALAAGRGALWSPTIRCATCRGWTFVVRAVGRPRERYPHSRPLSAKTLKRSVATDPAADAALKRAIMDRAPDAANAAKFREWLDGHDRVLRQAFTPEHLADLQKIGRASEMLNRAPEPKGTVQLPKSLAGKFSDVTGNSLPGITAAVTNVERGRSNPLYEFFKSGVALWGRQHQRAVDAHATARGVTASEVVRQAVAAFLAAKRRHG